MEQSKNDLELSIFCSNTFLRDFLAGAFCTFSILKISFLFAAGPFLPIGFDLGFRGKWTEDLPVIALA